MIRASLKNMVRERDSGGYTLFELVVTMAVLAVLVMGTIPIMQKASQRQKEIRLRESLRLIRGAIDEFKRDTVGACPQGAVSTGNPTTGGRPGAGVPNAPVDPRSRVIIDDCTVFETDNLDRYPPSLETLVDGVRVKQRGVNLQGGGAFDDRNATEINSSEEIIKRYLSRLPVDPMTGEDDWVLHSSYQEADDTTWDNINVFDIRSASDGEALNGDKYSDW